MNNLNMNRDLMLTTFFPRQMLFLVFKYKNHNNFGKTCIYICLLYVKKSKVSHCKNN